MEEEKDNKLTEEQLDSWMGEAQVTPGVEE